MSFSENLQNLRKIKNMSQEQLAEKLEVSRQAVSKWESGSGYPETEKILVLCSIFDCSMDTLMKGKVSDDNTGEKRKYEKNMNAFSKGISLAITIILIGVTILVFLSGINLQDTVSQERLSTVGVLILLTCVLISVPMFIVLGIRNDEFKKKNPKLPYFYSDDEIDNFNKKFPIAISFGVGIILLGVIILIALSELNLVSGLSTLPVTVLMICVTIGTPVFVYFGIQKDKYDIDKYNNVEKITKVENEKVGKYSGVIMILATAVFFTLGFVFDLWRISWVAFPIGGFLCAIVSIMYNEKKS